MPLIPEVIALKALSNPLIRSALKREGNELGQGTFSIWALSVLLFSAQTLLRVVCFPLQDSREYFRVRH